MVGDPGAVEATLKSRIGAILRATSGNFLEMFDFFLFGFYASATSRRRSSRPATRFTALLLTFAHVRLGFLMRPLGAIVLGAYIDRIGRRKGLIVTLAIMASGTVLIAFVPELRDDRRRGAAASCWPAGCCRASRPASRLGGVSVYLSEIATPGRQAASTPRGSRRASRWRSCSPRPDRLRAERSPRAGSRSPPGAGASRSSSAA